MRDIGNFPYPARENFPHFVLQAWSPDSNGTLVGERNRIIPLRSISNLRGEIETVFRRDIAQLSGSGLSLMPEGLENAIGVEQIADLIAFLLPPP